MNARKHARRTINRRRAKRVADIRELHAVNEWLLAVKASASGATLANKTSGNGPVEKEEEK